MSIQRGEDQSRVISNLIDNSVEAISTNGLVSVTIGQDHKNTKIIISDNGSGMPPHVLEKLGQKGNTYGKAKGSGLGFFHAKETITAFGGKLEVVSQLNQGTNISISLPNTENISNFFNKLDQKSPSKFVVVEDEKLVHEAYKMLTENMAIHLEFYDSPEALISQGDWDDDTFFLIDFDFSNSELNGLNLIQKLNLQGRSVLVSGRWNDPEVALSCEYLGVKRFPKEMLGFLPILNQKHEEMGPRAALTTNP